MCGEADYAVVAGSWVARRRAAEEASRKAGEEGQVRQKKKRKRPMRYPKGFDPQNPGPLPNPERWLPKWQRSDFKKKRNRRKDKVPLKKCCFITALVKVLQHAQNSCRCREIPV